MNEVHLQFHTAKKVPDTKTEMYFTVVEIYKCDNVKQLYIYK
jgi:hypothetical protein